ncbi:WblE protein [Photorhabdus luminescens subsp. luminescens]|uniref:D-glucuronyl C5-epimerase C-terminus n=1 Tax=Photorhabdus luminescens TaxID=29488 RepID=A0A1G5RJ53_PHOLU|nr:D-glucuronyl C5-epimerase family protein [Photorhabdus luminescens]KMW71692.1 WblE protein [Photorhabdus luminescens subsp. luminescens]SCZ74103.1 D-glucuronyl C5-epimerase C-terminus [Photorhabdus luminescens]
MKKSKNIIKIIPYLIIVMIVSYTFNKYAYELDEFNGNVRNLVMKGKFTQREFNSNGFPLSHSPHISKPFLSPFYVVHYGLIYSSLGLNKDNVNILWRTDSSLPGWNVPPPTFNQNELMANFKFSADWLLNNIKLFHGENHYLYDFDWSYKGYKNNKLSAPWWSGLTDAYAIILLLRAYDYFDDDKYLLTSKLLYQSSLAPIQKGGSLTTLDNMPWIEEYVDPQANSDQLAFVLNGMIYSTYGIESFENYLNIREDARIADKLYQSISHNIFKFDIKNEWSSYDLIGNPSNIKYHKIHTLLLKDLIERNQNFKNKEIIDLYNNWNKSADNSGYYYIKHGPISWAYYQFITMYFLSVLVLSLIYFFIRKNAK